MNTASILVLSATCAMLAFRIAAEVQGQETEMPAESGRPPEIANKLTNPDRGGAREVNGRAMVPTDLFAIRHYGTKAVSPDGNLIALEISGRVPATTRSADTNAESNQRTELWIAYRNGSKRRRLTPQLPVRIRQWDPVWSPDSKQLAFLSNEGQDNYFLEVWNRSTGRVKKLVKAAIDGNAEISRSGGEARSSQLLWVDDNHLLTVLVPAGLPSDPAGEYSRHLVDTENAGVAAAREGRKPTAIAVSSPPRPTKLSDLPEGELVRIDAKSGSVTTIGGVPEWQSYLGHRRIMVSLNEQWAALAITVPPDKLSAQEQWTLEDTRWVRLGVVELRNLSGPVHWVEGFRPAFLYSGEIEIAWDKATTSSRFAVLGHGEASGGEMSVAAVESATAQWTQLAVLDDHQLFGDDLPIERNGESIRGLSWLRDGRIALRVQNSNKREGASGHQWWVVTGANASLLTSDADLKSIEERPEGSIGPKLETSETGRIFTGDSGHEITIFPDLNPQVAEIDEPQSMSFEYKGLNGEMLHADLLLPHGYVQGKSYPTVVWAYGGDIRSGKGQPAHRDDDSIFNLMLLSGRGYAVLIPSMPLTPEGIPGEPMAHLDDGVDPAVDHAIALGIADPNRLAVMGHSYGGYSTFGLLTQTHRYRAGIAMMGVSDLVAQYGQFSPIDRFDEPRLAAEAGPYVDEFAQGRMGVPLWSDPQRYIRNSPVFYANKIITPLLIIAGDLDPIGAQQSEEIFTSLNRQGKRAEFVRYLGEGHTLDSPANIQDMWQRVFGWLDTYVMNAPANTGSK